jgi:predicted ribosomally synthesized peptide with nif11-like leader
MKGEQQMNKMKELYEKVAKDNALQAKFNAILSEAEKAGEEVTKQKLLAFAKEAGYEVSLDEMKDFFKGLTEANGELSDSELDQVAGGKTGIGIALSIASLGIGCATISAAVQIGGSSCKDYLNQ